MTPQVIETRIRELLASETDPWTLSDKLFGPDGLFGLLGPTHEDRKRVGRLPLFKEAQKRIRAMEHQRAELFGEKVKKTPMSIGRAKGA